MNRVLFLLASSAFVCLGADSKPDKKAPSKSDMSEMPAEVHAPLFQQKTPQAGKLTERVTAELPKPPINSAPVPHRNFVDDSVFGKMERNGIPHAPLSTDLEFIRRIRLDLTG